MLSDWEFKSINLYIAIWGWHVCAVIFLNSLIILGSIGEAIYIIPSAVALFICEAFAWHRQNQLRNLWV